MCLLRKQPGFTMTSSQLTAAFRQRDCQVRESWTAIFSVLYGLAEKLVQKGYVVLEGHPGIHFSITLTGAEKRAASGVSV